MHAMVTYEQRHADYFRSSCGYEMWSWCGRNSGWFEERWVTSGFEWELGYPCRYNIILRIQWYVPQITSLEFAIIRPYFMPEDLSHCPNKHWTSELHILCIKVLCEPLRRKINSATMWPCISSSYRSFWSTCIPSPKSDPSRRKGTSISEFLEHM